MDHLYHGQLLVITRGYTQHQSKIGNIDSIYKIWVCLKMGEHSSNLKLISLSAFSYKQNCYTLGDSTKKMFVYGCIHFPCESWYIYIYIQKYTYTYFNFKYIIIWCIHHDVYIYIYIYVWRHVFQSEIQHPYDIHFLGSGVPCPVLAGAWRPAKRPGTWPDLKTRWNFSSWWQVTSELFFIGFFLKSQRNRSHSDITWWLIPLSKWVITPVINGISRVNPLKKLVQCGPPSCVCWFRFAPVTSSLFAYHKP